MALTLGRSNWPLLKETYETLANDMQWKVRKYYKIIHIIYSLLPHPHPQKVRFFVNVTSKFMFETVGSGSGEEYFQVFMKIRPNIIYLLIYLFIYIYLYIFIYIYIYLYIFIYLFIY